MKNYIFLNINIILVTNSLILLFIIYY